MDEPEVKKRVEEWLTKKGYKWRAEPNTDENHAVRLDHYAYREADGKPEVVWMEEKGDANLSTLLEGFVRLEYTLWLNGGNGFFVCPNDATTRLLEIREFLSKQVSGRIAILDIERGEVHQL